MQGNDPFSASSMGNEPVHVDTTMAFVLAIFTCLCACLPGGALAAFLAYQAKQKATAGDEAGAKQQLQYSYIASGISLLLGIPLTIFYVFAQSGGY